MCLYDVDASLSQALNTDSSEACGVAAALAAQCGGTAWQETQMTGVQLVLVLSAGH